MTPPKGSASWLELLLRDAPLAELDRRREQALDEHDRAEAARALQLHSLLRERAQRASELSALSEIATALTSVRDLGELLNDVAVQARRLLRTDVAYLAVHEGDHLKIRYFDGTLGPSFREVDLSLTGGLAGRVYSSGKPVWTSDYLADASLTHSAQADTVAADEQLRSILGVPVVIRGETYGVLMAAERRARPFTDGEVGLLSGLAAHAAIAMETARLFDKERSAADELREAYEQLRTSAATVDRAIVMHERLMQTVVGGGGPHEVVDALADVLGQPIQLVGAHDEPLAGTDLGSPSAAKAFAESTDRRTIALTDDRGESYVLCPVIAAEEYLGCLIANGQGSDVSGVRLLERGALGIALALVQDRALNDAAARTQGELLAALIDGGDADVLTKQAAAVRVVLSRPHIVAVIDPLAGHESAARSTAAELAQRHNGLVVDRAGRSVLLVPAGTDLAPLARHATVGVSPELTGAAEVQEAFAEARRCAQALLSLGRTGVVGDATSLGVYRLLLATDGQGEAAEFVRRTIGALLEHDAAKGTELTQTLEEYLNSGRQHTATAERLHIHPNTLYQRLGRIGAVLGEGWREPDAALDLHVALRLHRLAQQL